MTARDKGAAPEAPVLLFICTGNICRSPMAQAIAIDVAREMRFAVRVESAGTSALSGHGAHDLAREALAAYGIDAASHRARQVSREHIHRAALVVTATKRQRDDLRYYFPDDHAKILSFDDATGLGELDDPFGAGADAFARTAQVLRAGMPVIMQVLKLRAREDAGA